MLHESGFYSNKVLLSSIQMTFSPCRSGSSNHISSQQSFNLHFSDQIFLIKLNSQAEKPLLAFCSPACKRPTPGILIPPFTGKSSYLVIHHRKVVKTTTEVTLIELDNVLSYPNTLKYIGSYIDRLFNRCAHRSRSILWLPQR